MPTPTIYTVTDWHSVGFVDTQLRTPVNLVEHFDTYQGRGSEKEEGYDDDDDDDDELQWQTVPLLEDGMEKFTTAKFPKQCPLFLLSRVGSMQDKALGSAAGKVIENGMLEYSAQNFL